MNIIVNPHFKSLIRPLSAEEYEQLEKNIFDEGCRDPLVIWNDTILDGHNRYEICKKHDIPFKTISAPVYIRTKEDAEDWIDKNQLGRRNLTPDDFKLILGRRYNRMKKAVPNPEGVGGKSGKIVNGQNDHQQTAERLAVEHGVSERTVRRAGKFAGAVDEVKTQNPDLTDTKKIYQLAKEKTKGMGSVAKKTIPGPGSAIRFAEIAISQLDRIRDGDPETEDALCMVQEWIDNKRKQRS